MSAKTKKSFPELSLEKLNEKERIDTQVTKSLRDLRRKYLFPLNPAREPVFLLAYKSRLVDLSQAEDDPCISLRVVRSHERIR